MRLSHDDACHLLSSDYMLEQCLFPFQHRRHNYLLFAPEKTEIHGITFARSQTVCN